MLWQIPLVVIGKFSYVCQPLVRGTIFAHASCTQGSASSALARGILVLPGGTKDTVTPLNDLSPLRDNFQISSRQAAPAPVAAPVPLRIMALGASVTFGTGSSTGNSYRKDLRDMLVASGSTVNFVGEFTNGNFTNRQVEATPGFVISQIADSANKETPISLPNLVLMDAGTNNCNKGGLIPDAGANVSAMISNIFAQSPGSTVILTTILVNAQDAEQEACRVDINNQYTAMAAQMTAQGAKLVLVDMRGPDGPTTADLADKRHPNDVGYQKMATVWFQGIQQAVNQSFVTVAADNGIPADGGA